MYDILLLRIPKKYLICLFCMANSWVVPNNMVQSDVNVMLDGSTYPT